MFRNSVVIGILLLIGCQSTSYSPPSSQQPSSNEPKPLNINRLAIVVSDKTNSIPSNDGCLTDVEDSFAQQLLSKGYHVADRSDVASALREIGFQNGGLTDSDATKIGHMLNVPAILIVDVTSMHAEEQANLIVYNGQRTHWVAAAKLSCRLVNIQTDELMLDRSQKVKSDIDSRDQATSVLGPLANNLAESFPSPETPASR